MNARGLKTALLVLLIIGVVVQTGKLWFEESSGHNFFSSILSATQRVSEERYKIPPESVIVNLGNSRFVKLAVNAFPEIRTISETHMEQLIKNGKLLETLPLDRLLILDLKSVIYEYPLTVPSDAFARSYGEAGGDFKRISGFDSIIVMPARSSSEIMNFFVVDGASGVMHRFETQRGVSEPLSKEIDALGQAIQSSETGLVYISSAQNSLNFFSGHVFLPEWRQKEYVYSKAYVTNPFEDSGGLERNVQFFFDNPAGLLSAQDPAGVPFVSDKEAVVKYFSEHEILEYTCYSVKKTANPAFDAAYGAARNFMNRDNTLKNDVCLTGSLFDDDEWTFYFDYEWDGLRAFSDENHAIEITVIGEKVSKYRRNVKRIERSELYGQLDESFIAALDRTLSETENSTLENMALGYDLSKNGFCEMAWFVERGGQWYYSGK